LNDRYSTQLLAYNQQYPGEPLDIPDLGGIKAADYNGTQDKWKSYLGTTVLVNGKIHCSLEFVGQLVRANEFSQWDHELLKVMAQWIGDEVELKIAHDAQRRHESEFARVSRMSSIGEMAASLAHELNQPLTGAINYCNGCLRMLQEGSTDTEKLSEGMRNAVEGATMAADIIRRIRGFVQKGDAQHTALDLNSAVLNVVALIKHEIQRLDVEIELKLQAHLPPVMGNMIQLEQVVLNFIRNGLDAMHEITPDKRALCITTSYAQSENIMLSITDTGSGISTAVMPDIFNAFYTTRADGMGIGLSISRSIIEAHQGTIRARSLTTGGSEFVFELPAGNLYERP
ncbi:hypothetical protein MNBD_GAMMA10-2027, partial [hydrothermal vent metagenome]